MLRPINITRKPPGCPVRLLLAAVNASAASPSSTPMPSSITTSISPK